MVKHIIIWTLKEELSAEEKSVIKRNIKTNLEALVGIIDGLISVNVQIENLSSSNGDIMLDSTFENEEALKAYAIHPEHIAVADRDVRPFTSIRSCVDFVIAK